tara:strand:- start:197 stop:451 length:255 start_codon:yes stop_codon:yes gene_type:complete
MADDAIIYINNNKLPKAFIFRLSRGFMSLLIIFKLKILMCTPIILKEIRFGLITGLLRWAMEIKQDLDMPIKVILISSGKMAKL